MKRKDAFNIEKCKTDIYTMAMPFSILFPALRKAIVTMALVYAALFTTQAQQPYSLVHYDENILPQTTIGNIQQDKTGYLWMNSQFGIVRFDGAEIKVFTTDNLKGLTSNRIRVCAKSPGGSVYFVDENHTVLKVKSPNNLVVMASDYSFNEQGLPLYSPENNNDFAFLHVEEKIGYNRFIDSLNFDRRKEILKYYATGLNRGIFFYFDLQGQVKVCHYNEQNFSVATLSDSISWRHSFKLNNLVFIQNSPSEALSFQNEEKIKKIPVLGLPVSFKTIFKENSPFLFSNESGTFLYAAGRLYRYELKNDKIIVTLLFKDMPCTGVTNVMQERSTGDYFISTQSEGFYVVKKKRFGAINLIIAPDKTYASNTRVNNNIVYAITLWDKQHLFAGAFRTGIYDTTTIKKIFSNDHEHFNRYFLYKPDSTHIWVDDNSLVQSLDINTGNSTPLLKIFDAKKAIPFSTGTTILIAAHKIVAVRNNRVTELYSNDTLSFTTAEKVSDNCLAIGTSKGLYYFYPSQKKLQYVIYPTELKVRFIFRDKRGRLWLTTYGQGLFYLSGNSIIPLPGDNNSYLSISHSIIEDNSGNFWISTNHGLFKIPYASLLSLINGQSSKLYYTYFDKTDGFNTNEFNGGCSPSGIYQPETRLMFFPSMDGIIRFYPDSVKSVTNTSPVFIDEIVVNDTGHWYTPPLQPLFPRQSRAIRIFFSSPYYGHPENIKFSYALSTDPGQWKEIRNSRSLILANLPGGDYTLTLKKEEAASPPVLTSMSFTIQKKFSETIFFKLLVLALVVALVYLYFKARLHYLNRERKRLSKEVAVRTADQVKLIAQLKDSLAELTRVQYELSQMIGHKENIIAVLIHDIKSPLRFLTTVAELLDKSIDVNPSFKNKEIAREIAQSLNRLYLFTQDFAIWVNASIPGHIQKKEKVELKKVVAEVLEVYREIGLKKGITLKQAATSQFVCGDEPMIKSVIRNLVDNAVKNTSAGLVTVSASGTYNKETGEVIIADEGKGLSEEQIEELNLYFRSTVETLTFSSSQFGHKIIKDFLQKMGGSITYRKNNPNGIIVVIGLPVYKYSL